MRLEQAEILAHTLRNQGFTTHTVHGPAGSHVAITHAPDVPLPYHFIPEWLMRELGELIPANASQLREGLTRVIQRWQEYLISGK